jgi:CubicO group peptidase (beta-lactamase class C family)
MPRASAEQIRFRELSELVRRRLHRARVPGAAIGIWADGHEDVAGFGITSVEQPAEITPRTLFQIGSITKTYTATLALGLEHQGLLDLDAPVRTYLPRLKLADRSVARAVTMRHLLTHSAGFDGEFFDDFGNGDDALVRYVDQLPRLEQLAPLGAHYSYCNAGWALAGRVIEVVAGAPVEQVMRERIFEPLGLDESFFSADDVISRPFAVGHGSAEYDGPPEVVRPWGIPRAEAAVGGIVCSVPDLLRWARFNLEDPTVGGRRILPRAKLRSLRKPGLPARAGMWIGLGWHLWRSHGVLVARHGGGTIGQKAELWLVPERRFACAIVMNSWSDGAADLADRVWDRAARLYLGSEEKDPKPKRIALAPDELARYAGRYSNRLSTIDLTIDGSRLLERETIGPGWPEDWSVPPDPPPRAMAFYERDQLFPVDPGAPAARTEFLRDADGHVRWYRWYGRALLRET